MVHERRLQFGRSVRPHARHDFLHAEGKAAFIFNLKIQEIQETRGLTSTTVGNLLIAASAIDGLLHLLLRCFDLEGLAFVRPLSAVLVETSENPRRYHS